MADPWDRIARQVRDTASYVALLRTQELPTLIVTALDAHALRRQQPHGVSSASDDDEEARIVGILLQMIENKWASGSLAPDLQRLVDYAHDWASETLLALAADDEEDAALSEMQRALFTYRPHRAHDQSTEAVTAIREALTCSNDVNMDPGGVEGLLEACAIELHDDERFVEVLELVLSNDALARSLLLRKEATQVLRRRLLSRSGHTHQALFDSLSSRARVCIFASDLELWNDQLDRWLVRVHETPFAPVEDIIKLASDATAYPAPLYAALIEWTRHPARRAWIRATRSRSLVATLSHSMRDAEGGDAQAFGRTLLSRVPKTLLSRCSAATWSPRKRAFVLQHIANALVSNAHGSAEWMEFVGVIEHGEIVHCAIDVLLCEPGDDVAVADWSNAAIVCGWFESLVHGATRQRERRAIRETVEETANALHGAKSWQRGLQWLQQNRSTAFASLTMTRLRMAWRWMLKWSLATPALPVNQALESIEYALRRFTATENPRGFQIELMATFLDDLQWVSQSQRSAPATWVSDSIETWLLKLVRLLPSADDVPTHGSAATLSQQVEQRLAGIKADRLREE